MLRERCLLVGIDETETVEIRLRGLPRDEFEQLLTDHPGDGAKSAPLWDVHGLAPALLAGVLVDPPITETDAREWYDTWSAADVERLLDAAFEVCTQSRVQAFGHRLRRDPQLMAVMAYCGPRGIPRSTFLAWPEEDQDAALAWAEMDRTVCSRCGTEPADFDEKQGGDRFAFVAERRLCPGCELIDQEQESLREEIKEDEHAGFGTQIVLARNVTDRGDD